MVKTVYVKGSEVRTTYLDGYIKVDLQDDEDIVFENGEWVKRKIINIQKGEKKKQVNKSAKEFISTILKKNDWGDTYEEALSELQNTLNSSVASEEDKEEARKLIDWVESVWMYVSDLEEQIENATSVDDIESVKFSEEEVRYEG